MNLEDVKRVLGEFDGDGMVDLEKARVSYTTVQQVSDMAFYNRRGRWIDSRVVQKENEITPSRVVEYGSPEYYELARHLAGQNRQGAMAFRTDVLLVVDGENVLIKAPTTR